MGKRKPEELIWERIARAERTASRARYDKIIKAAMRIADREGLDAISMRNIAAELRAGTMSLYRYVTTKDQILDLLLDAAYGEIAVPPEPSGKWQDDLRRLAHETRRVLKRHSWLGPLLTSRPTLGPNYLRWFEYSLASVTAARFEMKTTMRIVGTVNAYLAGVVGYELGEAETNRRNRITPEMKRNLAAPYVNRMLATGGYPQLAQFLAEYTEQVTDADFDFGVTCVLAGAAQVAERGSA